MYAGLDPSETLIFCDGQTLCHYNTRCLDFVSDLLVQWTEGKDRPQSGSLVKMVTQEGETKLEIL